MCRLKDGVSGLVVDVRPRSDADTAHHRRELVGHIVAVQVQGSDDRIILRSQQGVLQESVADAVLHHNLPLVHGIGHARARRLLAQLLLQPVELAHGKGVFTELLLGHLVAPALEAPFGELHDIALVHQRHRRKMMLQRVLDGRTYQPFRPLHRYRLHAEGRGLGETHLCHPHLVAQEGKELLGLWSALLPFDTGIDILGVLAENVHVDLLRLLDGRDHALEPTYGTQADIQVERLAQRHVQRADATAHRCRQRSLDANQVLAERLHRGFGQPLTGLFERLSARQHLFPFDGATALVSQFHCLVHNFLTYRSDFRSYPIAFNERHGHLVRDYQLSLLHIYFTHVRLLD